MYLKRIIAHGFKSFADNTIIDLENNIAGIVGPNGSGKSNIVDAIRWVLGEQSVKSLRGDSMTDVIFSGSKSRNPMNVATVSLVFDNKDHYLNIDFEEVEIKRRLYKDGTNEFFINQDKCRLKDISDLLIDSGIAKESFNIISQGKIEDIISSKPENRRVIFEEASGVLKYKKRKEEALRKLDKTNDNMQRIGDIINELESQVEPLREQKIIAQKYFDLNDELKEIEIALISDQITNLNYNYQLNKEKIDKLNKELLELNSLNITNEAKAIDIKSKLSKIEVEINNSQNKLLSITKEVEQINTKKQLIIERKKQEINNIKVHNDVLSLKEERLNLKNNITTINNDINNKQKELELLNKDIDNIESDIIKTKSSKLDVVSELNTVLKNVNTISIKIDSLKESIESNSTLPTSVKNILNNPKLRGIHNTIGSIIEVEKEFSKAISVIIQSSASNVIVDNELCAKEAIEYLKQNNLGRVTFFPLNIIKGKFVDADSLKLISCEKNYVGIASDLVRCNSIYDNIIKNQLGNVIVVRDIDTANIISRKINYKYRIVTLDGEIIHVGGSLTGGIIKIRNIINDKYELENNIREKEKYINEQKLIEEKINKLDYDLKNLEDKLYVKNKDKVDISEFINFKNKQLNIDKNKLIDIENRLNITDSIDNKTIDIEEENVLNEYYAKLHEKEQLENSIELLNNNKIKLNNELEEFNFNLKQDNSTYSEKNNLLHNLEIEVNRADVKLDTLLNTLNETYGMTYEKAVSLYKLDIDASAAHNKVVSLKRQIKELGIVNTAAIEEYERVSTRYEFLIHQQEDLTKAQMTLLDIIDEMDKVMKEEFLKTFKIIQENFSITFKELFKGGAANLKLTDTSNILETGIEIEACPPGKTLKNINLLSGGEKTFTAISLLFAILKSRLVPFCILDEVEAALDEVNVESFGEYIKRLKEKTQFLVITHKKKTMEYVDILYGITMQESGVSKLVSVKLEDIK